MGLSFQVFVLYVRRSLSCHVGAAPLEHGHVTVRMSLGFCHSESDVCRSIERESEKFGGPVSAVGSFYPSAVLEQRAPFSWTCSVCNCTGVWVGFIHEGCGPEFPSITLHSNEQINFLFTSPISRFNIVDKDRTSQPIIHSRSVSSCL